MGYKDTLQFLYSQLPMYQRIGKAAYKADLTNTIALCKMLGEPQNKFKSIHIAGTNGKGSVSHILSSILQTAGFKAGLYTSPHYKDFRERIRVNGRMINKAHVMEFVKKYKTEFESINPSFFEMTVGLAFDYFAAERVDLVVLETGMGGRLDSTNIVTPLLSVITNIGLDHTDILGDTLEKIAIEKAVIIKDNIPVVIGERQEEVVSVFERIAKEKNAEIYFAGSPSLRYEVILAESFRLGTGLLGNYQKKNISTVLKCIEVLNRIGYAITEEHIKKGLKNVVKNTGFMARWQILSKSPLTICDAGHNADGIKEVAAQIRSTPHQKLHFVLGTVNDKDITPMLKLLPKDAVYYFCAAKIPRAMDADELALKAANHHLHGRIYSSVADALAEARKNAGKADLVFVSGSSFVVAEVI